MTQQEYDDYLLSLLRDEQGNGMKEGGEVKKKSMLDELLEAVVAGSAGFGAQVTPDKYGNRGLVSATLSTPELLGLIPGGAQYIPAASGIASADYDEHLNNMLARYGLADSADLDTLDKFALAMGETVGQIPLLPARGAAALKRFAPALFEARTIPGARAVDIATKPIRAAAEYFSPTAEISPGMLAAATGIGGGLRTYFGNDPIAEPSNDADYDDLMQMLRRSAAIDLPSTRELTAKLPARPTRERMAYTPPSFPGMAEGGLVYDPARIESMVNELMEPQKLAKGGLPTPPKGPGKDVPRGRMPDAEAGRIAEAVQGELRPTPVVRERGKAVRRQGPGYDIEAIASEYPTTGPGRLNFKNPEKPEGFMEKVLTPEERLLQRARNAAQKDIGLGNYDPLFALEDRYYATPSLYDIEGNTLIDAMPKKQETIDRFLERFDTPEIRSNLLSAYYKGLSPMSEDWYALGQLQDAFIRDLGPEEGARQFSRRFADAMAATTGGADPTANLLMAAYVNNRKLQGLQLPEGSPNYPHPIGGRYLSGNMRMADKILMQMRPLTSADQPKRFNFRANFLGDRDRATIDEQMSSLYEPKLKAPPGASYGIMEGVLGDVARSIGVRPANFQDVAWAGAKGVEGKPMMQHINEAIERTSRVTGRSPEDVLRDSIIRATRPLYAKGGLTSYKDMIGA